MGRRLSVGILSDRLSKRRHPLRGDSVNELKHTKGTLLRRTATLIDQIQEYFSDAERWNKNRDANEAEIDADPTGELGRLLKRLKSVKGLEDTPPTARGMR